LIISGVGKMGESDEARDMNERLNEQQRKADELSQLKLEALTRARLDIQKSFGAPQWSNPEAPESNDNTL